MIRSLMGTEKKTMIEEAKTKMRRGARKHQEVLVEFSKLLVQAVPETIFASAELNRPRVAWDMRKSKAFETLKEENRWFLLGNDDLTVDEWQYLHETVISQLKAEAGLSWILFDRDTPSTLILIWD